MATLGMPGDMLAEAEESLVSTWRVGGHPLLPPGVELDKHAVQCQACHSQLALVVQVSSSNAGSQPTATLVFGCTQRGCGKDSSSWSAVSLRLRNSPAVQQQHSGDASAAPSAGNCCLAGLQPRRDPPDQAAGSSADAASAWSCGADDWQDAEEAEPREGEPGWGSAAAVSYDSLAEQLSRAGLSATEQVHKSAGSQETHAVAQQPAQQQPAGRRVLTDGPSLPEFRLWQSPEPDDQSPVLSAEQQKHIAALLRQYETEISVQQVAEAESSSGTGEAWSGEAYERMLPRGVSSDFMRFKKALDRCPQQCVRCGGEPLWPREASAAQRALKCPRCSSDLRFRLQLMSPLLVVLEEAAEWLGYQDAAREAMHDWQWLSVAVFTCSGSCQEESGLQQEAIVIMNE